MCPIVVPLIRTSSISNEPPLINPVVVIADEPVSIVPNPEVIEPAFNAPDVVRLANVVIAACVALVTVAAVPEAFPVTLPVKLPVTEVVVNTPVLGL